jgi:hypothetical protein
VAASGAAAAACGAVGTPSADPTARLTKENVTLRYTA